MAQQRADDTSQADSEHDDEPKTFPVAGIGASAGGLQAFETFFKNMPPESGVAFVLVQHLDPNHESEMAELLQNHTQMPVTQLSSDTKVEPNHVYIIPPNKRLSIEQGVLKLAERERKRGSHAVIDLFFRALASDRGSDAVCIVLSGTGTDGTQGLKAIKEAGGITFAQSEDDAEYPGMPRSAAATGLVDFVLDASAIPEKLIEVKKHGAQLELPDGNGEMPKDDSEALQRIFTQLKSRTGHDFSNYKRNTVLRRIGRRMQVHGVANLPEYLQYLRGSAGEANELFKELLISVTNFFRDPEAFKTLETEVIPKLFDGKEVRVWVSGCATGEEAYSIAILLAEHNATLERPRSLQIFASDIDEGALEFARRGVYPDSIATDVSEERLERFFTRQDNSYTVNKRLREMVLFTSHNLVKDAPFSNLDLITCRNLLIYLDASLQEQVYKVFHYALRPGSYLFLGTSETLGTEELFNEIDRKAKLFGRNPVQAQVAFPLTPSAQSGEGEDEDEKETAAPSIGDLAKRALVQYTPVYAVVNKHYDIVHLSKSSGKFLEQPEGAPTRNIVNQAKDGLSIELRTALYRAFRRDEPTQARATTLNDGTRLNLSVELLEDAPGHALVVFEEGEAERSGETESPTDEGQQALVEQLEDELTRTRESLQTTIEELETSNEELRASNQELQSMNEELRSTTEELETSKEELQSTNEELITVNDELQNKVEEIAAVNSDLENLISSTDVATLFLDGELRLKRFTPKATEVFNLIQADLGRPFSHVSHALVKKTLDEEAREVLRTLQPVERDAETADGRSYIVHILPYRTVDNRIDGVVLTLVEVTELVDAQREAANRAGQQAVVANLGQQALGIHDLNSFTDHLVATVAETLQVDFAKVLEKLPDEDVLLLKAGVGWDEGIAGTAKVGTELDSQAGFTLVSSEPVVVEDLSQETRFSGPALLRDHQVISGVSVIIEGDEEPYGVLGVHTKAQRSFTEEDVSFVQAIANVLAQAIRRDNAEAALQSLNTELESRVAQRTSELQREKEFSEQLVESSTDGILAFDTDLRYTVYNEGMRRISGVGAEDAVGNLTYEVFPFLEEIGEVDIQRATLRGERSVRVDESYTIPSTGQSGFFEARYAPLRDAENEIIGGLAVVRDTTERKKTEDELRASEERFRAVFEQGPSATCLLILDDWLIIDANDKCEDVLGYPRGELKDKSLLALDIWENPNELAELETMIEGEDLVKELELSITKKGGEQGTLLASLELIVFGGEDHVLLIFDDITERKRAKEELRTSRRKLIELEERGRLNLARELHDGVIQQLLGINHALTQLEGNLAGNATHTNVDMKPYRQEVLKLVEQLRTMITDLRPAGLDEFGLKTTLESFVAQLRAGQGGTTKFSSRIEEAKGLSSQLTLTLYRVAQEALRNAVKHARAERVGLELSFDTHRATLKVQDDGQGFDPPSRLSSLVRSEHFGLVGIEERLDLLGGTLQLDTEPGHGTTLLATIPLDDPLKNSTEDLNA